MDKQTTCQLVQGISKLGGCAHPKVSKVCKSYLLNASGRSKICQKTPLSPPGALCCSETAYHILTKKKTAPTAKTIKKYQKNHINFTDAFSGRQAEASADLRWARRTASARNWLEIVPPLRSLRQLCVKASQMEATIFGMIVFQLQVTDFSCIPTWSKRKWKILSDKILPGHTNRATVTFLQDVNVSKKSFKFWTSKSSKSLVNRM